MTKKIYKEDLKNQLLKEEIPLPENFFAQIQKYKELLYKWNKVHNLTGAKTPEMVDAFIYDSVYPVKFLPKVNTLLDIGTGAGFPGMILAIAMPNTQVTLAEPLSKRASFLQFVKADLDLANVSVVKKRVETMVPKVFDLVTSRAVTDTQILLKLSKDFRDETSKILFYKGENVYKEVDETMHYKIIKKPHRHYLLIGENIE